MGRGKGAETLPFYNFNLKIENLSASHMQTSKMSKHNK